MKILISNDDGVFAPGIAALAQAFSQAGHEVYVCAPDSQRSAASHSMTLSRPLQAQEVSLPLYYGMTDEQIARIFEQKQSDAESTKIGVYNVNERLQYYFGSEASMRYYSELGRRTMVMLVLPIVREKEGHGDEA